FRLALPRLLLERTRQHHLLHPPPERGWPGRASYNQGSPAPLEGFRPPRQDRHPLLRLGPPDHHRATAEERSPRPGPTRRQGPLPGTRRRELTHADRTLCPDRDRRPW